MRGRGKMTICKLTRTDPSSGVVCVDALGGCWLRRLTGSSHFFMSCSASFTTARVFSAALSTCDTAPAAAPTDTREPARRETRQAEPSTPATALREQIRCLLAARLSEASGARGMAGGFTRSLPSDDRRLQDRSYYEAMMTMALGGALLPGLMTVVFAIAQYTSYRQGQHHNTQCHNHIVEITM